VRLSGDGAVLYISGMTGGSFDGGASFGAEDAFLIAVSSQGDLLWTRQIGTSASDYARGV
jgi:hypothetical protein